MKNSLNFSPPSNYTVTHLHDTTSNCNGFADSCSHYDEYIELAKKCNMKAIAFTNHGGIYDWVMKKMHCDKAGIKYIHGIELYICRELTDNDRGGHICLYAKNYDGVLELNELYSLSTSKGVNADNSDRHMYFNPRISMTELENTSDNILVTTACVASPLNRWEKDEDKTYYIRLLKFLKKNKHRCFLEVQYHNQDIQTSFNKKLVHISKSLGVPLIAATDTHSSSKYKEECRKILQISKDSFYGEEDSFDLVWKTYDELVSCFKEQAVLSETDMYQAIQNTNVLADMVEDFKFDFTFKYPTLYGEKARELWLKRIGMCLQSRMQTGEISPQKKDVYLQRIKEEFQIMCKQGMESFMLFVSELCEWCEEQGIPRGTGRGSVCGSVIAFVTGITDVDPVVWDTIFSRFVNADRISLADIDVDFSPEDRPKVYEYIINRFGTRKTAYIAAFSTLDTRGCIDVLAKGLNYNLEKAAEIKDQYDSLYSDYAKLVQAEVNLEELVENGVLPSGSVSFDHHEVYLKFVSSASKLDQINQKFTDLINSNQDLFYYLNGLKGTIIAKGNHPSGMVGSPISLPDSLGVYYKDGNENFPITTCAMKSVDSLNYVKFDILGLKTVGVIKDVCEMVGIHYPKAYQVDWANEKVWSNMIQQAAGVFQFESPYSFSLLSDFRPKTINHMSMVNAALRPSGASYRDRMIAGEFNKNPSDEIDNLLESNNGFLIFQEDTIKFLSYICGFTGSEADTTRRAIGKKDKKLLDEQLPKILEGYCNNSSQPRDIAEQEAKQFIQIIEDSSSYQFGYNHSTAYSMNGFLCTMMRCFYPAEFIAAYLNRAQNSDDIKAGTELAHSYGFEITPIEYGKSLAKYSVAPSGRQISKGIESIKFCNAMIAQELYQFAHDNPNIKTFAELLNRITKETSIDSRQIKILIILGFFRQYGKNQKLLTVFKIFEKIADKKQIKKADIENGKYVEDGFEYITYDLARYLAEKETEKTFLKVDMFAIVKNAEQIIPDKSLTVKRQIKSELEYLEYIEYQKPDLQYDLWYVAEYKTYSDKTKPYVSLYNIKTGETMKTKVTSGKLFVESPFFHGDILFLRETKRKRKRKKINGLWTETDEYETVMVSWDVY